MGCHDLLAFIADRCVPLVDAIGAERAPKRGKVSYMLPTDLIELVWQEAIERGCSRSEMVEMILRSRYSGKPVRRTPSGRASKVIGGA
jgi:hypothetical protein